MYGSDPNFQSGSSVQVDPSFNFTKGEWGVIQNHVFHSSETFHYGSNILTLEASLLSKYIAAMKAKGADVKFVRAYAIPIVDPYEQEWSVTFYVEKCVFVGDPIVIDDIVLIVLAIAGVAVTFMLLYPAIIYHLVGLDPKEVEQYNQAQSINYLILGGLILLGVYIIYGLGKGKGR